MEREVGGGIGMGNTCKPMAVSFQCMTKFTTNKKKGKRKKKKNSAAMNIGVHVSLSDLVSSVCMPSSGIAGSYGSSNYFHS